MNVSDIGIGRDTHPSLHTGNPVPLQRGSPEPSVGATPVVPISSRARELARTAWFDLNGDGRIQPWPSLYGGDGYFVVSGGVSGGTRPPARQAPQAIGLGEHRHAPVVSEESESAARGPVAPPVAPSATSVVTRQAIDAYARYGGTSTGSVLQASPQEDAAA